MRLHITGGYRCGTTLMRNLMVGFEDTWIYHEGSEPENPEVPQNNATITVTKCGNNPGRMARWLEDDDVKLIVMLRDLRDMSCSIAVDLPDEKFSDIRPDAMVSLDVCVPKLLNIPGKMLLLRYEDLVSEPNNAQEVIASFFDLTIRYPFLEAHKYFPSVQNAPEQNSLTSSSRPQAEASMRARPIDTKSVGIWKQHECRSSAEEFAQEPIVREFLSIYYPEEELR